MTHPNINSAFCSNLQRYSRKFILEDFHIDNYLQVKIMLFEVCKVLQK